MKRCLPGLALCGALLVIGCSDRRGTTATPAAAEPVTPPPVATPPTTVSAPVQEPATRAEQTQTPESVAGEDKKVLNPPPVPCGRVDAEIATPVGRETVVGQEGDRRSDDVRPPAQTGGEEEDVTAALRREAAEIERQRDRR